MQVVGGVLHHGGQFHLLRDVDTTPLIQSGQGQQILHQNRHAGAGRLDMRDGFVRAFQGTRHIPLHLVQFRVSVDGGKRSA